MTSGDYRGPSLRPSLIPSLRPEPRMTPPMASSIENVKPCGSADMPSAQDLDKAAATIRDLVSSEDKLCPLADSAILQLLIESRPEYAELTSHDIACIRRSTGIAASTLRRKVI